MKARLIIDDITREPHPFTFRGREYDLQKTFAVTRDIKLFLDNNDAEEMDVALVALASMMRDSDIRAGREPLNMTPEQIGAWVDPDQYSEIMAYINTILVPNHEETVDTSELDAIVDKELDEMLDEETQKN